MTVPDAPKTTAVYPKPPQCMYLIHALIHCTARLNTRHCSYKSIVTPIIVLWWYSYMYALLQCCAPSGQHRVYQPMRCYITNTYVSYYEAQWQRDKALFPYSIKDLYEQVAGQAMVLALCVCAHDCRGLPSFR